MNLIRRTTTTLLALVAGLIGLSVAAPVAFAVTEPPGPASDSTSSIVPVVSSVSTASSWDLWEALVGATAVAATAVVLTITIQRLVAVHHSHAGIAKA